MITSKAAKLTKILKSKASNLTRIDPSNGYRIYVDIYAKFRLLITALFIGQYDHILDGEQMG